MLENSDIEDIFGDVTGYADSDIEDIFGLDNVPFSGIILDID